jgi:hypothetical protein
VIIGLRKGCIPSWAFGILTAILAVPVIVRIIGMVGSGCLLYDFSTMVQNRRKKVKGPL